MATITKPMALDESFNTTESIPRNQADVLVGIETAIRQGFGQVASAVEYDNADSGLTADNVQDAIDEVDDTVDGLVDDVTEISSDIESTQTVSGNPITITDCAPINAESLVVELEPKQDLHGQSYPYVGGAGKNKLPMTVDGIKAANTDGTWSGNAYTRNGVTFTVLTDDGGNVTGIDYSGTPSANPGYAAMYIVNGVELPSGNYILNGGVSNNAFLDTSLSGSYVASKGGDTPIVVSGSAAYVRAVVEGNTAYSGTLLPMLRLATETDPTFAPYSNICPITGYTECEVDDVGKNLISEIEAGMIDAATGQDAPSGTVDRTKGYIPTKPSTAYTFSGLVTDGSIRVFGYGKDKSFLGSSVYSSTNKTVTLTVSENTYFIRAQANNTIINTTAQIQCEEGSTATSFESYHSSNATIQFGQTVYGGRSNFTDGGTDDEYVKIVGVTVSAVGQTLSGVRYADTTHIYGNLSQNANTISDRYSQILASEQGKDGNFRVYQGEFTIYDNRFTDIATAQNLLNDVEFCYQKNNAITLPTPPTDLKLLKGTNNLTTNGTTITLGYQPDNVIGEVKGEIEKCSPNPEFMHFEVNENVVDAIPIIFDEAIHSYTVSGDNWKDKKFLCVECCDMRYGILQRVLSSDMAFVDSCGKALMLYPYMRSIKQYIKITISLGQSYGYEISYQTTNTSSLLDYLKIRVRLFN